MTMGDDGFFNGGMSPCEVGTDCTDCGVPVRAVIEFDAGLTVPDVVCNVMVVVKCL